MPGGINGLELFRKATEIAPGMKVLLSSGFYGNTLEESDALSGTNAQILAKPYKMAELFEALDHAFEGD
jgi:DNA-binding NtrC family response regulator